MEDNFDARVRKAQAAIRRSKATLIRRAAKSGIYENFGDHEQRAIWDKYWEVFNDYYERSLPARIDFQRFRSWCMDYTGRN